MMNAECTQSLNKGKIKIFLINNDFLYEIENLVRLFLPYYKIDFWESDTDTVSLSDENYIYIKVDKTQALGLILIVRVYLNGIKKESKLALHRDNTLDRDIELEISGMLFKILSEITKVHPKWGIITGVRPVKLFRSVLKGHTVKYCTDYFKNKFLADPQKIELAAKVNSYEQKVIELSKKNSFSLYVSIPFCPSRCAYCSFVSQSVEKSIKLIPDYLNLLTKEIKYTAKIAEDLSLRLETIYIGGGTPTVLSCDDLRSLINVIVENFDTSSCREFTVEAGRPDTLDKEKIDMLSSFENIRVSINPQTFNDSVLQIIGRKHTANDTFRAVELAKNAGISNINMDLIAGLPGDSYRSFCDTIKKTIALNPSFVTIHTLAVKRASNIVKNRTDIPQNSLFVEKMLEKAYSSLSSAGYHPYYLYRQSKMVDNMENTGWAKGNLNGLYNIYIMDETHTILACGAGAVTKLKNPFNFQIKRIFNFKFAYEYISRFNEIIERKGQVTNFYEEFQ